MESGCLQFRSKDLFVVVFATALVLAFVAKETFVVATATIFCCISWIGLAVAIGISGSQLVQQLLHAIRYRQWRLFLSKRIKWMMIDGVILVWLFVAIAAANFVLENYVSGARAMVFLGLALSPLAAALLLRRRKP